MAIRVTKTGAGGSREFAAAAAASQTLRVSELDGDLDAIFNGITDSNILAGANIATAKLASDSGIVTGMLGAGSVTTTILANQPNGVTTAKLNINASVNAFSSGQLTAGGVSIQNTTQTLITLASMTTRGGRVELTGTVSGLWAINTVSSTASWVLFRDATAIATWNQQSMATGAGTIQIPGHFSVLFIDLTALAGAHTYRWDLTVSGVTGATFTPNLTQPGFLFAKELA